MISKKRFYSGFCLHNEQALFDEYLIKSDFSVAGFSFGAQKAFEAVLNSDERIDTLQLFSPAFFQDKDEKYRRMQLMFFKKDAKRYCDNFLQNVVDGSEKKIDTYFKQGSHEELDRLLHYTWQPKQLQSLVNRGVNIEVYIGAEDKIVDAQKIKAFFVEFATVYLIKDAGHIL